MIAVSDALTGRAVARFDSQHRANVFCVIVVGPERGVGPGTQIASAAADGQVRLHVIQDGGIVCTGRMFQHEGRAHKLSVSDANPCVLASGDEAGRVVVLDLRDRPPAGGGGGGGGRPSGFELRVKAAAENGNAAGHRYPINVVAWRPHAPTQLLVAGGDEVVRLFDVRRVCSSGGSGDGGGPRRALPPVVAWCPLHMRRDSPPADGGGGGSGSGDGDGGEASGTGDAAANPAGAATPARQAPSTVATVTGAAWSWDGRTIVATYNDERAYRFDVDDGAGGGVGAPPSVLYAPPAVHALLAVEPDTVDPIPEEEVAVDAATTDGSGSSGGAVVETVAAAPTTSSTPDDNGAPVDVTPRRAPLRLPDDRDVTDAARKAAHHAATSFNADGEAILHWSHAWPAATPARLALWPPAAAAAVGAGGGGAADQPPDSRGTWAARFVHHVNSDTIKGVSFYGPRSEYVAQGCDSGRVFVYDAATGGVVNMLPRADTRGAVNCLSGHPDGLPLLLTSGLEHVAKLWGPSADTVRASEADVERAREEATARAGRSADGDGDEEDEEDDGGGGGRAPCPVQ